ncbi:GntR family transcriptional regulator [uncultured Roseobacter sp.]|uniref:GntR family transcriptional regulator n=1 Tax=uncultured Roseobacter sp. TaxID=114847 RepID=UPI00263480B6|nr:GntR family transcriptional regulator [uncultured Roseobacter sp.]
MAQKTRVDLIYETLRDRICLGVYQPGDTFHESELGREFEVSRTPIRQALQRLEYEKLASVRTGVGTIVEPFSVELADGYLELRARMISAVSELGMISSDADTDDLTMVLQGRASRLSQSTDPDHFWQVLKAVQDICLPLLADDVLRHMESLLFFRSAPALMTALLADPGAAAGRLQGTANDLSAALNAGDPEAFFDVHSRSIRAYRDMLNDGTRQATAAP